MTTVLRQALPKSWPITFNSGLPELQHVHYRRREDYKYSENEEKREKEATGHRFKSIQGHTLKRLYCQHGIISICLLGCWYLICNCILTYVTFNKPSKWNETCGIGQLLYTTAVTDELRVKPIHRVITRSCVAVYSRVLVSTCECASMSLCVCLYLCMCVFQSLCRDCTVSWSHPIINTYRSSLGSGDHLVDVRLPPPPPLHISPSPSLSLGLYWESCLSEAKESSDR